MSHRIAPPGGSQREYYVPFHTDGEMSQTDLILECYDKRWLPLLAIRRKGVVGPPTIPLFLDRFDLNRWVRKNLPSHWTHGMYILFDEQLPDLEKNGWVHQIFHVTRRLRPDEEVYPEILDVSKHELFRLEGNHHGKVYELDRKLIQG